jgi:hypothetical protein
LLKWTWKKFHNFQIEDCLLLYALFIETRISFPSQRQWLFLTYDRWRSLSKASFNKPMTCTFFLLSCN